MMAKPMKTHESHYPMIKFLRIQYILYFLAHCRHNISSQHNVISVFLQRNILKHSYNNFLRAWATNRPVTQSITYSTDLELGWYIKRYMSSTWKVFLSMCHNKTNCSLLLARHLTQTKSPVWFSFSGKVICWNLSEISLEPKTNWFIMENSSCLLISAQ